jgi:hypothetical protein
MRKVILPTLMAFIIVGSAHAQGADPSTPVGAPATPAAAAPKAESAPTPTTASPQAPASEATPAAGTSPVAKSAKKRLAKHETDERKARRIAAKYGVYW